MDNLDDILNGKEEAEVTTEAEPQVEAPEATEQTEAEPEKAERPRGPDGKFIPKGETEVAPPATEEPPLDHAALIGERRRRQEAEAEREALRQQLAQFQQPQQPVQPQGPPDMFEDPEGYTRWIANQAAETARAESYQTFQYQRIEAAATQFAPTVPDYAEKVQVFQTMAQANPGLLQELYRAPNPAEYAYNVAKIQLEINQYGGLEGLIKARIEGALKAQAPTPALTIPDTLATAQSARGSAVAHEPLSLEDILGR